MRTKRRTILGWLLAAALLLHVPWPAAGDKICLKALPFPALPSSADCERGCCGHVASAANTILGLPGLPVEGDCCIACAPDTWFKCETRPELRTGPPSAALGVVATTLLVRAAGTFSVHNVRPPGGSALARLDTVILRL